MKTGLNRTDQSRCAAAIKAGYPISLIAKKFDVPEAIAKRFTVKAMKEADGIARSRTVYFAERKQEKVNTAEIFKTVLQKMGEEAETVAGPLPVGKVAESVEVDEAKTAKKTEDWQK